MSALRKFYPAINVCFCVCKGTVKPNPKTLITYTPTGHNSQIMNKMRYEFYTKCEMQVMFILMYSVLYTIYHTVDKPHIQV